MFTRRIIGLLLIIELIIVTSHELELPPRPMRIRPETFIKKGVVKNYFDQLKTSQSQNVHRYGKRFSEFESAKVQQQLAPEKWQDIYEIIKHYEENQPTYY